MRDHKHLGDMEEPVNFFLAAIWAAIIGCLVYAGIWLAFL